MWLLDLFGSGSGNLKTQNLKSVLPCACFHGFFSRVLGFPVTMLHTLGMSFVDVDFIPLTIRIKYTNRKFASMKFHKE